MQECLGLNLPHPQVEEHFTVLWKTEHLQVTLFALSHIINSV